MEIGYMPYIISCHVYKLQHTLTLAMCDVTHVNAHYYTSLSLTCTRRCTYSVVSVAIWAPNPRRNYKTKLARHAIDMSDGTVDNTPASTVLPSFIIYLKCVLQY